MWYYPKGGSDFPRLKISVNRSQVVTTSLGIMAGKMVLKNAIKNVVKDIPKISRGHAFCEAVVISNLQFFLSPLDKKKNKRLSIIS